MPFLVLVSISLAAVAFVMMMIVIVATMYVIPSAGFVTMIKEHLIFNLTSRIAWFKIQIFIYKLRKLDKLKGMIDLSLCDKDLSEHGGA